MPAKVPGDIFTDAHRAGIIPEPYLNENDVATRWLANTNWTCTAAVCALAPV